MAARTPARPPAEPGHLPVMLAEVLQALAPVDGDEIADGTFGGGGYSRAILKAAQCSVIGIDRDLDAIDLIPDGLIVRVTIVHLSSSRIGVTSSPAAGSRRGEGLSPFGKDFVRRLDVGFQSLCTSWAGPYRRWVLCHSVTVCRDVANMGWCTRQRCIGSRIYLTWPRTIQ